MISVMKKTVNPNVPKTRADIGFYKKILVRLDRKKKVFLGGIQKISVQYSVGEMTSVSMTLVVPRHGVTIENDTVIIDVFSTERKDAWPDSRLKVKEGGVTFESKPENKK